MAAELTSAGSHRATVRGAGPGGIVEPGQPVPAGIPIGSWMEPAEKPKPVKDPLAAFDHDGDGKPGGAPKGGNRKK